MINLEQRGDTIVEVLLSLVIVSSVLAGAYVTSNRSFRNSQQSQERGEAIKFVEAQLERLKAQSSSNGSVFTTANYCFNKNNGNLLPLAGTPNNNLLQDDFSTAVYPDECNFGNVPGGYHMSVVQTNPIFTVRARWENVHGSGRDEVKITYKLNQ